MIDVGDLMVGNIVQWGGDTVHHADAYRIIELHTEAAILATRNKTRTAVRYAALVGIPISREWLRKLGFWKYYKTICRKGNHEFYVNQDKARIGYKVLPQKSERAYMGASQRQVLVDVEYVHQLQNLVRILANEELTIGVDK